MLAERPCWWVCRRHCGVWARSTQLSYESLEPLCRAGAGQCVPGRCQRKRERGAAMPKQLCPDSAQMQSLQCVRALISTLGLSWVLGCQLEPARGKKAQVNRQRQQGSPQGQDTPDSPSSDHQHGETVGSGKKTVVAYTHKPLQPRGRVATQLSLIGEVEVEVSGRS